MRHGTTTGALLVLVVLCLAGCGGRTPNLEAQSLVVLYGAILERAVPTCESVTPGYKTRFDSVYKSWQDQVYNQAKITDEAATFIKNQPDFQKGLENEFARAFNGKSDIEIKSGCEKILSDVSK